MNPIKYQLPDFQNREERRRKDLDRMMHNPIIRSFLSANHLTVKAIEENFLEFLKVDEDSYVCDPCTSLENCSKYTKGMRLGLTIMPDGSIEAGHMPCEKMKAFKAIADHYVIRDFENPLVYVTTNQLNLNSPYAKIAFAALSTRLDPDYRGKGIYLHGPSGVGKTFMMIALANEVAATGKSIAFVSVKRLIEKVTIWMREKENGTIQEALYDLSQVDFLVLDDLGREQVSVPTRDGFLLELIERRIQSGKMNVFATSSRTFTQLNKDYELFKDGRQERLISRLKEVMDAVEYEGSTKR